MIQRIVDSYVRHLNSRLLKTERHLRSMQRWIDETDRSDYTEGWLDYLEREVSTLTNRRARLRDRIARWTS